MIRQKSLVKLKVGDFAGNISSKISGTKGWFGSWWNFFHKGFDATSDIQLNTSTWDHNQTDTSVVGLGNDTFMAVWQSEKWWNSDSCGVYGQKLDSSGNKIGRQIRISEGEGWNCWSDVASVGDGMSLAVWKMYNFSTGDIEIRGRFLSKFALGFNWFGSFDGMGKEFVLASSWVFPEIWENPFGSILFDPRGYNRHGNDIKVAELDNDNYVVIWDGLLNSSGTLDDCRGIILNKYGKISTTGDIDATEVPGALLGITGLDNGNFAVMGEYGHSAVIDGVYVAYDDFYIQIFDGDANKVGDAVIIDPCQNGSAVFDAGITELDNGNLVVVWQRVYLDVTKLHCQILDDTGDKIADTFEINTYVGGTPFCDMVAIDDNNFAVVWRKSGDIHGQILDETGNKISEEFLINDFTSNNQQNPSIEYLGDDKFVVTWESFYQDGDGYGVYSQIFDADDYITEEIYGTPGVADVFDFNNLTDSTEVATDTIMDFEQGLDVIDLQDLGFVESDLGVQLTYDIVDGMTTIHDAESDFAVELVGEYILAESDFVFAA